MNENIFDIKTLEKLYPERKITTLFLLKLYPNLRKTISKIKLLLTIDFKKAKTSKTDGIIFSGILQDTDFDKLSDLIKIVKNYPVICDDIDITDWKEGKDNFEGIMLKRIGIIIKAKDE